MARTQEAAKISTGLSAQVVRTLREGALWVFGALALILWVALFTYDPADPGFTQATSNTEVSNGVGRVGALIADLLFNLFGRPAYLFTVMVFYLGWMIFKEHKNPAAADARRFCAAIWRLSGNPGHELWPGNAAFLGRRFS